MAPLLLPVNMADSCSAISAILVQEKLRRHTAQLSCGWMKWYLWFIITTINIAMWLTALFPSIACTPINTMGVIEARKVLGAPLSGTLQQFPGLLLGVDGYYSDPCRMGALGW
ncbi:hypothetical protein B0T13DRAFT_95369 [Neurospora crassa]|nr:hypothetical protein B0T13DRAFT_95369 [Neurospora crassa]